MCKTAQQFVVKQSEKETILVEFKKHHSLRPHLGKDKYWKIFSLHESFWIILFYTKLFFQHILLHSDKNKRNN